jgi:hypothetical protein
MVGLGLLIYRVWIGLAVFLLSVSLHLPPVGLPLLVRMPPPSLLQTVS